VFDIEVWCDSLGVEVDDPDGLYHRQRVNVCWPSDQFGEYCYLPKFIHIHDDLPVYFSWESTCSSGYNYNETCLDHYDSGEDVIYWLEIENTNTVDVTMSPKNYVIGTGIAIGTDCPPFNDCIASDTNITPAPRFTDDLVLDPGDYYMIVDKDATIPGTPSCSDFELKIEADDDQVLFYTVPESFDFFQCIQTGSDLL
jgi:hypothetical protein